MTFFFSILCFISPFLMLFFLVFYFIYSNKKFYFSLGFLVFSSLTYLLHINPYLVRSEENLIFYESSLEGSFKIALLTNYIGDPIRDNSYLNFLWEDFKKKGFNAMIVKENLFTFNGFLDQDPIWRIFSQEGLQDSLSVAFDYSDWLTLSRDSSSPLILWIDSRGEDFYIDLLGDNLDKDTGTLYLTLPKDFIEWSSLLKPVNLRIISL